MNVENNDILRRKKITQDDKDFTSSKISELARYIGFGLAAIAMVLLTSSSEFAKKMIEHFQFLILLVSGLGVIVILLDYIQYYFGYMASDEASRNPDAGYTYDVNSFYYRSRRVLFNAKQIIACTGALLFIAIIIMAMFRV